MCFFALSALFAVKKADILAQSDYLRQEKLAQLLAEDGRDIRRETALALKEGPFLALEITGADLQGIFLRLTEGERI